LAGAPGFHIKESRTMASVQDRVIAVTSRVLKVAPEEIQLEHHFSADLGAESVQSIELVAMFEEEFGINMDEEEALSVETVGRAIEFITEVCKRQGVKVDA
jgi:acyl carrier protein